MNINSMCIELYSSLSKIKWSDVFSWIFKITAIHENRVGYPQNSQKDKNLTFCVTIKFPKIWNTLNLISSNDPESTKKMSLFAWKTHSHGYGSLFRRSSTGCLNIESRAYSRKSMFHLWSNDTWTPPISLKSTVSGPFFRLRICPKCLLKTKRVGKRPVFSLL